MKAILHRAVPLAAIPARLPPLFRTLIGPKRLGASPVTLAVFSAASAAVVTVNAARRLLARLGDAPTPLVVVGYNFTQDAVKVLRDAGATPFAASGFRLPVVGRPLAGDPRAADRGRGPRVQRQSASQGVPSRLPSIVVRAAAGEIKLRFLATGHLPTGALDPARPRQGCGESHQPLRR